MVTPRVSNRYPRRGERLAPATLRELLREPVPEQFRQDSDDDGLMLCDLDERAWQRFPEDVLLELAKLIVERVARCHGREAFQARHFPRPAAGLRLEDLRLENRTRRCLAREGFEDNPRALGDLSIGQVVAIRAFGPRCLVDLLAGLESAGAAREARAGMREGEARLSGQLTAAARRLAAMPEAELIRREDPRFAGPMYAVDIEARTAAELAERLVARRRDPPEAAYAAEQVEQLCRRVERLSTLTLEEELVDVFANGVSERNRQILTSYHGWADGRQHTLREIGRRFGVTRERVRQVCVKLTRRSQGLDQVLAPVMDRALAAAERRLPAPAPRIEAELAAEGLTRVGMSLEAVAHGAELLGRTVPFRIVKLDGGRLAVAPEEVDAATAIADMARKEVYFRGLSTIERVLRRAARKQDGRARAKLVRRILPLLDGFAWLDESAGWFRLAPIVKHGLPRMIDKILSVAGSIGVTELRTAITRNRRLWKTPPPENVLLEYCRQMPGVKVEEQRIIADPPRDWRKSLGGIERALVSVLRERGPVMDRGALEDLCVAGGMNRFSFHAFVSWSPVLKQVGHSVYGLVGREVSQREVEALIAARRAKRRHRRVLEGHRRTEDGKIWLAYKLSKAASTYAVVTVPAPWRETVRGRFRLENPQGEKVGTLAARGGRAWGLGAHLRRCGVKIGDQVLLTIDPKSHTAVVSVNEQG